MGLDVDKRLKIDEPVRTIYLSHKPCLIKVIDTAPSETIKADEIMIKTAKKQYSDCGSRGKGYVIRHHSEIIY
jgi:hypothetical protein